MCQRGVRGLHAPAFKYRSAVSRLSCGGSPTLNDDNSQTQTGRYTRSYWMVRSVGLCLLALACLYNLHPQSVLHNQTCMIYCIINPEHKQAKIGYSANPASRLKQLKTGCPFPLSIAAVIQGTVQDERALHQKFAHLRGQGEWFSYAPELREHFQFASNSSVKVYESVLAQMMRLQAAEFKTLLYMMLGAEPTTRLFLMDKEERQNFSAYAGLGKSSINNSVTALVQYGLLERVAPSLYKVVDGN